jgi:hypothetical protein
MNDQARRINVSDDFGVKVVRNIYAFDSTTIDLYLSVFCGLSLEKQRRFKNAYPL